MTSGLKKTCAGTQLADIAADRAACGGVGGWGVGASLGYQGPRVIVYPGKPTGSHKYKKKNYGQSRPYVCVADGQWPRKKRGSRILF